MLARDNGTFRRASGWAGEKAARTEGIDQTTLLGGMSTLGRIIYVGGLAAWELIGPSTFRVADLFSMLVESCRHAG